MTCVKPIAIFYDISVRLLFRNKSYDFLFDLFYLGPVAQSLVIANRWLRGIKTYRFPWYFAVTMLPATQACTITSRMNIL